MEGDKEAEKKADVDLVLSMPLIFLTLIFFFLFFLTLIFICRDLSFIGLEVYKSFLKKQKYKILNTKLSNFFKWKKVNKLLEAWIFSFPFSRSLRQK
jgi:hypothetical protein